ncbi:MAG: site-2 protease family protein [Anaerolineales bacterium]|nr:site-2 protease family protein [Anaerolineales bacterium]
MTLLIFLLVLSSLIFLHELGHFLISRLFGIEIEEFGFGIPPRALGLWRGQGYLILDNRRIEIPKNFERGFDWLRLLNKPITITVDQMDGKHYLRTLEGVETQEVATPRHNNHILADENGQPIEAKQTKETLIKLGKEAGSIKWEGTLRETHPGTLLSLNWLLLGGFVRARGEGDPTVPGGLMAANPWKRLGVYIAGPFMNLLTAMVIFAIMISIVGTAIPPVRIDLVTPSSPAEEAGILAKDVILEINGIEIENTFQASEIIRENMDQAVDLLLERNNERILITVTPLSTRNPEDGALGVLLRSDTRAATLSEMIRGSVHTTVVHSVTLLYIPVGLFKGVIQPEEARLSGFRGIYDLIGSAVERDTETRQQMAAATEEETPVRPTNWTLYVIAILSVSLGTLNLLPIPALDGGRILFTLPEILLRRRIPTRFENVVNMVAFLLLITLMLFVNLMDFLDPVEMTLP